MKKGLIVSLVKKKRVDDGLFLSVFELRAKQLQLSANYSCHCI